MKRSTKYAALDVHQATTITSVREESGRVIARTVLPTEAAAIVGYVRGMRGTIHVTFEEGTQAQWLHDLLVPVVDRVLVCDRRGRAPQGNKSDHLDADELSELLRRGALRRGLSRQSRTRRAQGTGADVPESGRGWDACDAPPQSVVPRPRDQDARPASV